MKVKLLKKLKKRHEWYFNKEGFPVLIDHYERKATVYDLEYMRQRYSYSLEDVEKNVVVPHQVWALRRLKMDIMGEYGYSMDYCIYKYALRRLKAKKRKLHA